MKRFAAIVTIALVILAMSAGTAFAGVCVGSTCSTTTMVCPESGTVSCPMGNGAVMAHSSCSHPMDRGARDLVSGQTAPEHAVVSTPLAALPASFAIGALAPVSSVPDARGAPHLTAVIRI